ncbi:hypothetical protein BO78DRAFT_290462, partial [Aspergillus sclerotiicarbonarius CBS 121057]
AGNITIMGRGDLHQDTADQFLGCPNATGMVYRLFVEEGNTMVLPPENQTTDLFGTDGPLLECMMQVSSAMAVLSMDADEPDERLASSVGVDLVTYTWLLDQGARGLCAIGTKAPGVLPEMAALDG